MTPGLVVFTMLATVGYLGLAVLGWSGFAAFFSHPAYSLAIALEPVAASEVARTCTARSSSEAGWSLIGRPSTSW